VEVQKRGSPLPQVSGTVGSSVHGSLLSPELRREKMNSEQTSWHHTRCSSIDWNKACASGLFSTAREYQVKGDCLLKLSMLYNKDLVEGPRWFLVALVEMNPHPAFLEMESAHDVRSGATHFVKK
jgi:hypothetical protein